MAELDDRFEKREFAYQFTLVHSQYLSVQWHSTSARDTIVSWIGLYIIERFHVWRTPRQLANNSQNGDCSIGAIAGR